MLSAAMLKTNLYIVWQTSSHLFLLSCIEETLLYPSILPSKSCRFLNTKNRPWWHYQLDLKKRHSKKGEPESFIRKNHRKSIAIQ